MNLFIRLHNPSSYSQMSEHTSLQFGPLPVGAFVVLSVTGFKFVTYNLSSYDITLVYLTLSPSRNTPIGSLRRLSLKLSLKSLWCHSLSVDKFYWPNEQRLFKLARCRFPLSLMTGNCPSYLHDLGLEPE